MALLFFIPLFAVCIGRIVWDATERDREMRRYVRESYMRQWDHRQRRRKYSWHISA